MRSIVLGNGLILAILSMLSGCQIITLEDRTRLDQATVLIENPARHATGFIVGENRILTSDHGLHLGANSVVFRQGERRRSTVIWHDSALDFALLDVDVPPTYEALPLRCRDAVKGERLWTIGHHGEARWVLKRGPIHTVKVMKQGYQVLGLFMEFGTAGSAVVNHRGELVGMVQAIAIMPIKNESDEGGSFERKKVGLMLPSRRFCDDVEQALQSQ